VKKEGNEEKSRMKRLIGFGTGKYQEDFSFSTGAVIAEWRGGLAPFVNTDRSNASPLY
jgi:hypothetical protein